MRRYLIVVAIIALTLAACGGAPTPTPTIRPLLTPVPTRTVVAISATPVPTRAATTTPTPAPAKTPTAESNTDATATAEMALTRTPIPDASLPQESGTTVVTARVALNVRSGPGTNYPAGEPLRNGDVLTVLGQSSDASWLLVRLPDGRGVGWVSADFTDYQGEAPLVITPTPAATLASEPDATPDSSPAETPTPSSEPAALAGKLVFQVAPGGPIYTIRADGEELRHVIDAGIDPTWSPDGSRIAYIDWRTPAGIYLADADGSNAYRLFDFGRQLRYTTWSPDGEWIAVALQKGGRLDEEERCFSFFGRSFCFTFPADAFWRLALVDPTDGTLRELRSDLHSFAPAWTDDSERLIFRGDNPYVPGIALRQISLSDEERQTLRIDPEIMRNVEVCQGQILTTYHQHDHEEIYLFDSSGENRRRLTANDPLSLEPPPINTSPTWSPDCRHIAFLSNRDGPWRIYVMNADGSNQQPMFGASLDNLGITYSGYDDHAIDWGNDGS